MIRIADAMGAAAVILGGHSVDPYNGKCLRASAGSIFSIPVVVAPDAHAAVTAVRAAGLQVLATTVDGETPLDEAERLLGRPTAWLFGPESHGLSNRNRGPGGPPGAHPDVRRRGEPECGRGRGDLSVPELAGAGASLSSGAYAALLRPRAGRRPASESVLCTSDPARSIRTLAGWRGERGRGGK